MDPHPYAWCPYKMGKFERRDRHTWKEDDVKTGREDGHLQAEEVSLPHFLPSQPSGNGLCQQLFQTSGLQSWETCISVESPSLWYFVTIAQGL